MKSLFGEIDNQKQISAALAAAWCEIETPKHNAKVKVKTNKGSYDFSYTDLGGIFDAIREPFKKHGLSVQQAAETRTSIAPEHITIDRYKNPQPTIFIEVQTKITHKSGEYILSPVMETVVRSGSIQDVGGQITYLKRYSLSALIGVSTEKDDDANASLGNGYDDGHNNYNEHPQHQAKEHKTDISPELYKQVVDLTIKVSAALGEEGNDFYKRIAKQLKLDENFKVLNNADAPKVINLMLEVYEEHKAKGANETENSNEAAEVKKEAVKK